VSDYDESLHRHDKKNRRWSHGKQRLKRCVFRRLRKTGSEAVRKGWSNRKVWSIFDRKFIIQIICFEPRSLHLKAQTACNIVTQKYASVISFPAQRFGRVRDTSESRHRTTDDGVARSLHDSATTHWNTTTIWRRFLPHANERTIINIILKLWYTCYN